MSKFLFRDILVDDLPEITIVDVGAMIEGTARYNVLANNYKTMVTGFEPNEEEYKKLSAQKQPSMRYLPCFLGDGNRASFNLARYPGCSSLYEADPSLIDLFSTIGASAGGNFEIMKKENVETERLDDVYDLSSAHYIKLDVQGAELSVLEHGINTLTTTLLIETEVEFVPLYKDQPLFGDVQCFLREQGFLLHKLIDVAGRCFRPFQMPSNPFIPMSQMLWADAVFVRDFTKLDALADSELLLLATMLHDVYSSYDLVQYILTTYDRRGNTKLTDAYVHRLADSNDLGILYLNQKRQP